ncbi:hypothetical protein [Burkholderia ambifaria]|uniref:hypothetical protein n=1 Tax=Burkholderia ambifaria TaxID=152480 RepID=UPI001ABBA874|nr:hypothetical protein [Burkholderia ambifaria]
MPIFGVTLKKELDAAVNAVMKKNLIVWGLVFGLTGCASWCNDSADKEKCLNRVHVAQAVGVVALVVTAAVVAAKAGGGGTSGNYPGNCQYDWQTAADGSRCGGRSAESRPGGY